MMVRDKLNPVLQTSVVSDNVKQLVSLNQNNSVESQGIFVDKTIIPS